MLAKALADFNVVARSEFKLKPEQEGPVKSLLNGKDVLTVLPTGRFPVHNSSIGDYRFRRIIERFPNNDFPACYGTRSIISTERLIYQKCHKCFNRTLENRHLVLSCSSR